MDPILSTRRNIAAGAAAGLAAAAVGAHVSPASTATAVGGVHVIPELAPQWKKLDLGKILSLPAAYVSISQTHSVYDPGGVQSGGKHRERGSLPATVKVGALKPFAKQPPARTNTASIIFGAKWSCN